MNILFLCTGNSCRSVLSEATFNHLAPDGLRAISAGSKPAGELHSRAVALLHRKGISTEGYFSKSWDNLSVTPDIVVTVCSNAAGETCPAYLGPVTRTHWGLEDPGHVVGTEEEIEQAFEETYSIILARTKAFLALPLQELLNDKSKLKIELDRIGSIHS